MEINLKSSHQKRKIAAFVLLVLFGLGGGLLMESLSYHLHLFDGHRSQEEILWQFGEKGGAMEYTTLSQQRRIDPGKTYELSVSLTYDGEGDNYPCAFITSGNYETKVYLDDELMFRYTKEERGFHNMQAIGGAAFTVPLGKNCQGRELRLELQNPMHYGSERRLPGVIFGDYASILQNMLLSCSPSILISGAILFTMLVLVLMGSFSDGTQWTYLHFSVFAYLIVLYRGMQDLHFLYTWSSPLAAFLCEFFSMVACPIPIMLAYRNELKPRFTKSFNWIIGLLSFNLVLQVVLHFTGIYDVIQFLPVTHLAILGCALFMGFIMWKTYRQGQSMRPFKKLIPIIVGAFLDLSTFYVRAQTIGGGSFFVVGNYIGLGLLVSLVMMVLDARKERERSFQEYQRNRLLEVMAYKDALTGLYNRAAFTKEVADIQRSGREDQNILVIAADLNGLKVVNDSMGHGTGDKLIQRASDLLVGTFGKYGKVFRTGGDEFFAILYDVDLNDWRDMKIDFDRQLEHSNSLSLLQVSIAMGHAFLQKEGIEACVQTADRRMYQNKSTFPGHEVTKRK